MRAQLALITLGVTLATACRDTTAPPPSPPIVPLYYLKAPSNSGDNQTDTVFATLALPFRVLVRRGDTPAEGVAVLWEMGGDTLVGIPYVRDTSVTDATGIAVSPFKLLLGRWPGTYAMRASVPGLVRPGPISIGTDFLCGFALCFTATAHAAAPTHFSYVSGDVQKGSINTPLGADFVVGATDSYGNTVAGVVIDWAVAAGGGSITPAETTTASPGGQARARATLGASAGPQSFTATATAMPGTPRVTFTTTAFTPAEINGIWDWTEHYAYSSCADTGSYTLTQTNGAFSGSSQQVGVCYPFTGPEDNSREDPVSNGIVIGDSIAFYVTSNCVYYGTVSGNPPDDIIGTSRCGSDPGTWHAVREQAVAAVTVTPDSQSVPVGVTLQLTAQLRDANGNRVFFRPITWVSANPAVASVSPAGIVLAVSTGSATITASAGGQSGTATVLVP